MKGGDIMSDTNNIREYIDYYRKERPREYLDTEHILIWTSIQLGDVKYLDYLREAVYACRKAMTNEN